MFPWAEEALAEGMKERRLPESYETRDPMEIFRDWFQAAEEAGVYLPEACCLATATAEGVPSARMVLLKALDEQGLVIYTNYESRKARELEANAHAALLFHWSALERQVRFEGGARRIPVEESRAYFATRDRGSQLGAWASRQSRELVQADELEASFHEVEHRFDGQDVPLPPFWGGYRLEPREIEFWQGRPNRLHDRLRFTRGGLLEPWRVSRLYP